MKKRKKGGKQEDNIKLVLLITAIANLLTALANLVRALMS